MSKFSVMMPPEWVMIAPGNPEGGAMATAQGMMSDRAAEAQAVAVPMIYRQLMTMASTMAEKGIDAVLMSAAPLDHRAINPMVVLKPFEIPEDRDPLDVLVAMAGHEPGATLLEVDHLVGLRTESFQDLSEDIPVDMPVELRMATTDSSAASRMHEATQGRRAYRVRYVLGVPTDRDRWIDIFGAVQVPADEVGNQFAEAYGEMFDVIVRSFEWKE